MRVKEIMHHVTRVSSDTTVSDAAEMMDQKSIGSVLIEKDDKIMGIMTERDILKKIVAKRENPEVLRVKDIMTYPIITVDANAHILDACTKINRHRIRRLIVIENGEVIGKVTSNSIARNIKFSLAKGTSVYTRPEY
jgi:signal-transduction protein with cAMP-binding, CBS, and nucleotidyltransferase domain